jgi:hypothetical protein
VQHCAPIRCVTGDADGSATSPNSQVLTVAGLSHITERIHRIHRWRKIQANPRSKVTISRFARSEVAELTVDRGLPRSEGLWHDHGKPQMSALPSSGRVSRPYSSPELVRHSYELLDFLGERVPSDILERILTIARTYII